MPKGGKRYSPTSDDGKWYAHDDSGFSEACTITGTMLAQADSFGPQGLRVERHLKSKTQDPPEFRFSTHDNREAIRDGICLFSHGLGRKKCPDDQRQHNSQFCLCHDDPVAIRGPSRVGDLTAYQAERSGGKDHQEAEAATNRRFPRSHRERSAEAAAVQAGEPAFMWFGRHDSGESSVPLGLLAATNCLATRI